MDKKLLMYVFVGFLIGYFFQSIMKSGFCRIIEGPANGPYSDGDSDDPDDYHPEHHATCQGLIDHGVFHPRQLMPCLKAQAHEAAVAAGRIAEDVVHHLPQVRRPRPPPPPAPGVPP